ncbi:MAG: SAM-dependent methyltransferase, partial [Ginsengibacter sp.]
MSFHDFMEMALYHPEYGYYTAGKKRIGKEGDYYTSPEVSSLYGQMIGKQLEEMYMIMGSHPMDIIEFGAGSGTLCNDILNHLKKQPAIYNNITYYIVEKNRIASNFSENFDHSKIRFISDISERAGFSGCVISNELLDNFP